ANTFGTSFVAGNNTANLAYTLPVTAPTGGQILSSTAGGVLSWTNNTGANAVTSLTTPAGSNANGGSIAANVLTLSLADGTNPGLVSTAAQTFAGAKTFSAAPTITPFSSLGIVHNSAAGLLSSSQIVNADITNATIDLTTKVTGILPVANGGTGLSSLGAGVATFLGTPSSANLATAVTDETGTGALVLATSPTLVTPNLGTPSAATLTNATGLPLGAGTTGTLTETRGGTNQTTYATGDILYASAANTLSKLAAGSNTQVLTLAAGVPSWANIPTSFITSLGAVGATPNANGASVASGVLTLQPADATNPGVVTTGAQTIAGAKTLTGATTVSNTFSQTGANTFGTGTGAVSLNGATTVTGTNTFTVGTGAATFGGAVTISPFTSVGIVHNSAAGLLSSSQIVNADITNATIDLTTKVTGVLPDANVANNLTIAGGAVDSTPIGATTASTGAFTTLAASGNITQTGATTLTTGTGLTTISGAAQLNSTAVIRGGNTLTFNNAANTFGTSFVAGNNTANLAYTLPVTAPTGGQILSSTAGGVLSW
ncbi:MAG: hypothetical protein WAY88_03410, partial [Minisyncoccia bacterium]